MNWNVKHFSMLNISHVILMRTDSNLCRKELTVHWSAPNSLIRSYLQPCTNSIWGDESEAVAPIIWLYQIVDAQKEEVFFPKLLITLRSYANCITWTQTHNPYKHSLTPTASPGHRHTILTNTTWHQLHHLDTGTQSLQTQPDTNCITWTQAHNPYKHNLTLAASPGHRHTILTNTASHQLHHLDTDTQSLQTQPHTNCITWTQTHNPYKHSLTPTASPGHRHTILTNTASHQLHHLDTGTQSLQTQPHTNCITWTQTHNPYKHSLTPTASPGHRHTILTNTAPHQLHHLDTDTQSLQTQPDTNCITWTQTHNPYKHSLTPTASPGHRHTILTNTASHQLHHLDTDTQSLQTQPHTNCITWTQTHNPYKHNSINIGFGLNLFTQNISFSCLIIGIFHGAQWHDCHCAMSIYWRQLTYNWSAKALHIHWEKNYLTNIYMMKSDWVIKKK